MQFGTSLIALLAAAGTQALPSQSSLDARQDGLREITVEFFQNGCNSPVTSTQVFLQQASPTICPVVVGGTQAFAVVQNNITIDAWLYSNDFCDQNSGNHFTIFPGELIPCSALPGGVHTINWFNQTH